jgi:apolipoprotein N-acyltransferase
MRSFDIRTWGRPAAWVGLAAAAFHAAYAWAGASWLILVYLFALVRLAGLEPWRGRYYAGLAVGLLIAIGRLDFFWGIFSAGSLALWYVYAFWIGLFVALAGACLRWSGGAWGWVLVPFLWTGLEYFRSELYYLRFSWLNPGYAGAGASWQPLVGAAGMYGAGFLLASVAAAAGFLWLRSKAAALALLAASVGGLALCGLAAAGSPQPAPARTVHLAGIQMECPTEPEVLGRLNQLIAEHPETELIVLSEYTFMDPVPARVKAWCRQHHRHLVVGGEDPAPGNGFYNTAFVIGPEGEIVFRQAKCVPIQFFKDGRPAPAQKLWDSPWGKIGICICYDLSYRLVTDRLVKLGAQALVVPTMDAIGWGQRQHQLHGRVAPVRAAEYALPIFRVASSGISQWVDARGRVLAAAPCPGEGAVISAALTLGRPGRLPPDRWVAPLAVAIAALCLCALAARAALRRLGSKHAIP